MHGTRREAACGPGEEAPRKAGTWCGVSFVSHLICFWSEEDSLQGKNNVKEKTTNKKTVTQKPKEGSVLRKK